MKIKLSKSQWETIGKKINKKAMQDKPLLSVTEIVDDSTGIWAGDLCEFSIHTGDLEDFLKNHKEKGAQEICKMLDYLKKAVVEKYLPRAKEAKNNMKIKLSKSQWEGIGKKAGWMKKAQMRQSYDPKLTTDEAKSLWFKINDYLMMASDPLFDTICVFRNRIDKIKDPRDKEEMKKYFESEFSGFHTEKVGAWEYYK